MRIRTSRNAARLKSSPYPSPDGPGDADLVEERLEVRRPALRHHGRAQHHLEQQVPADDPGDQLAEGGVGERVRRPGHRHRGGELRVAERRQPAADGREHEGQGDTRSRVGLGDAAGQGEDARADDHADAEDGQVQGGQPPLELELRVLGVLEGLLDALGAEYVHFWTLVGPRPSLSRVVSRGWLLVVTDLGSWDALSPGRGRDGLRGRRRAVVAGRRLGGRAGRRAVVPAARGTPTCWCCGPRSLPFRGTWPGGTCTPPTRRARSGRGRRARCCPTRSTTCSAGVRRSRRGPSSSWSTRSTATTGSSGATRGSAVRSRPSPVRPPGPACRCWLPRSSCSTRAASRAAPDRGRRTRSTSRAALPVLSDSERRWLADALSLLEPDHRWLRRLR